MGAKRTLREQREHGELMADALELARRDASPINLRLRLLSAVVMSEKYKRIPQWRQASVQGYCEGLALGRGLAAGLEVEGAAAPAEAPKASDIREIQATADTAREPAAPLQAQDIERLERLVAELHKLPESVQKRVNGARRAR